MEKNRIDKIKSVGFIFQEQLSEYGFFDRVRFNEVMAFFVFYDRQDGSENHLQDGLWLWRFCFRILEKMKYDVDPNDAFEVSGLSEDEKHSLGEILYTVPAFFMDNKNIEGEWAFL